jgi:uncharacterized protein (TIGR02118 family)
MVVVIHRRRDLTREQCQAYLRGVHGQFAERLPGLIGYRQNHVVADDTRRDPGWDAIVELWWESRDRMEQAWRAPEGVAATEDLAAFVDLQRTTWSIVEEQIRRDVP